MDILRGLVGIAFFIGIAFFMFIGKNEVLAQDFKGSITKAETQNKSHKSA